MASIEKEKQKFSRIEWGLIALVFIICFVGAYVLPMRGGPDERARRLLTSWMFEKGSLPTGNEPETIIKYWGFSYALRPYLPSMLVVPLMRAASVVFGTEHAVLVASRMCSVVSVPVCCYFCLRMAHTLFDRRSSAFLFAVFVSLMPQVIFLGIYQNNDAPSLAAVCAMLCFFIEGLEDCWSIKTCVCLGVSMSFALLTYYTIYGWILVVALFCILAVVRDERVNRKLPFLAGRMAIVVGICLCLAGWFFVRNALLHNGDFLGVASEEISRANERANGAVIVDYKCARNNGVSFTDFLSTTFIEHWVPLTAISIVGCFDAMCIEMRPEAYVLYGLIFALGIVLYAIAVRRRRPTTSNIYFVCMIIIASAITFGMLVWQSYARDYQPQGRYIIAILILFGYLLAYGMDGFGSRLDERRIARSASNAKSLVFEPSYALSLCMVLMFALFAVPRMLRMVV